MVILMAFCSQADADLTEQLKGYCQRLNTKGGYIAQAKEKCNLSITYDQIHKKVEECDTGLNNGERLRLMDEGRSSFDGSTEACVTARKIETDYFGK